MDWAFDGDEVRLLAHRAVRAGPAVGNLRPAGAGREAFVRAAFGFAVDVAAVGALIGGGGGAAGLDGGVLAGEQLGLAVVEDRLGLVEHLKRRSIGTRVMYPPINRQEAYGIPGEHPVSNLIGEKGLWFPSAIQLTDDQVDKVCREVSSFYGAR